jgi:hypothetical protein
MGHVPQSLEHAPEAWAPAYDTCTTAGQQHPCLSNPAPSLGSTRRARRQPRTEAREHGPQPAAAARARILIVLGARILILYPVPRARLLVVLGELVLAGVHGLDHASRELLAALDPVLQLQPVRARRVGKAPPLPRHLLAPGEPRWRACLYRR